MNLREALLESGISSEYEKLAHNMFNALDDDDYMKLLDNIESIARSGKGNVLKGLSKKGAAKVKAAL